MNKEHHVVMELLVVAMTGWRMVSEVLLLSLLMFVSTASISVNERYNSTSHHNQMDRWGLGCHLCDER